MILNDKMYHDWLIDCVEHRRFSWPKIALCLVHWVKQKNMTRAELLAKLKLDYRKASAQKSERN